MSKRKPPLPRKGANKKSARAVNAARRAMLIKEHRSAIKGLERVRPLMGDAWADRSIAYRVARLKELGARP